MDKLARFMQKGRGEVGLMVTVDCPQPRGVVAWGGARMSSRSHVREHRIIPRAVHDAGGKIAMQILHAGATRSLRFVSDPPLKSPISRFKPRAPTQGVERTIRAFVRSAVLAREAGYDGVEIMGSEGYLINQFSWRTPTSATTDGAVILNGDAAFLKKF